MNKDRNPDTKQSLQAKCCDNASSAETLFSMQLTQCELSVTVPIVMLQRTGTLFIDETVPSALGRAVIQLLSDMASIPDINAEPSLNSSPDLILTFGELPPGYIDAFIGTSPLTAITHMRVPVDNIATCQARELLSGTITDWCTARSDQCRAVQDFCKPL